MKAKRRNQVENRRGGLVRTQVSWEEVRVRMGKRAVPKEKTADLLVEVSFGLCLRGRQTAEPPGKACRVSQSRRLQGLASLGSWATVHITCLT